MESSTLKKNTMLLTGYQFVEQAPVGVFNFDNPREADDVFNKKTNGFSANGKVVVNTNAFEPDFVGGRARAKKEVYIVSRAKSRPVLIFQDEELSEKFNDNYFIIPIQTLYSPERSKFSSDDSYNKALKTYENIKNKSEENLDRYYIPVVDENGQVIRERALILSDARFVHKSMLYGTERQDVLEINDITEIGKRLARIFKIEELEKCKSCKFNYEHNEENKDDNVIQFKTAIEEPENVEQKLELSKFFSDALAESIKKILEERISIAHHRITIKSGKNEASNNHLEIEDKTDTK